MIGFKLGDYALPVIFLGAALLFFTSNKKLNNLGRILFGVGGIFFALNLMGDAVEPLKSVTAFKDYLANLGDRPVMGVIIGAGLTMLIQSSAAMFEPRAARTAVIVVPILSPKRIGRAPCRSSKPPE